MSAPRPASSKGWLARRPAVLAWVLQRRALVERLRDRIRSRPLYWVALFGALILIGIAFSRVYRSPTAAEWLTWLANHRFPLSMAAGLYAALAVSRRRAHVRTEHGTSWLAATPLRPREYSTLAILRIGTSLFAEWLAVAIIIAMLGLGSQFASAIDVLGAVTSGFAVGIIVGALLPTGRRAPSLEDSRYVFTRTKSTAAASFAGLSRWPIAAALAWHRPENSRWLFVVAALSVPMGSSALLGLTILTVASLGSYLFALARWFPSVAREAANWLRPTPIRFPQFAFALVRRMLVHQCVGTAILAGVLLTTGANYGQAAYFACFWMSLVAMIATIAARQSFRAQGSIVRLLVSALIVIAAEIRARGLGVGIATIIFLMHMRRESDARA